MRTYKTRALITTAGAIALSVAATPVFADTVTVNGVTWTYSVNNATLNTVTLGNGTDPCIAKSTSVDAADIPWTFTNNGTDYTVTAVANKAFYQCKSLTGTLIIPAAVTSIGDSQTFRGSGLTQIASLGGIARLPWGCFVSCTSLTGVFRLDKQVSMSDYQFYDCVSLSAIYAPGPDTGTTEINVQQLAPSCPSLKVIYVGPNVEMKVGGNYLNSALKNVTGCKVFAPTSGGWLNFSAADGGKNTDIIYYGADTNLNLVVDEDAKTITATPTDEATLLKMLEVAPTLKEVLGFDTVISINSDIDATVEITEEMLTNVKVEVPTWYLTFAVKTQAQLNHVLDATTGPIIADITGATEEITTPVGRKVAILAPGGAAFNYHKRGLIISFK